MSVGEARSRPFVSVVLSFYNEEAVIPELLSRLRQTFAGVRDQISGYELVFVNDASTDNSEELLNREIERHGDIVLISMSRNFGVSECVYAGFAQSTGDVVIYMDSDLQDPPELIPTLLERWRTDPDAEVVYTTRRTRSGEHPLKMLLTKVGYRFINRISNTDLPVDSGDFKLLSRRVVDEVLRCEEKLPYLRGLVSWVGFKQVQVYYDRDPRFDGRASTKFSVLSKRVIYGYLDRALISFSDAPLKLALFAGFFIAGLAAIYLMAVLVQKLFGWHEPGWPAIMATMLLLGGVQLIVLGFIGLYINVIFHEVKKRPNYIVKSVLSKKKKNVQSESGTVRSLSAQSRKR
ncbi:MAG: glycosyltransferase family 2 protein [Kiloniellales bacterium]|nr:glycosyltransferase family 2 protein [Kiloniellales bacterium]